jgi:hypothetical protein
MAAGAGGFERRQRKPFVGHDAVGAFDETAAAVCDGAAHVLAQLVGPAVAQAVGQQRRASHRSRHHVGADAGLVRQARQHGVVEAAATEGAAVQAAGNRQRRQGSFPQPVLVDVRPHEVRQLPRAGQRARKVVQFGRVEVDHQHSRVGKGIHANDARTAS